MPPNRLTDFTAFYLAFLPLFTLCKVIEWKLIIPFIEDEWEFTTWTWRLGIYFGILKSSMIIYYFFGILVLTEIPLSMNLQDSILLGLYKINLSQEFKEKLLRPLQNDKRVKFLKEATEFDFSSFNSNGVNNFLTSTMKKQKIPEQLLEGQSEFFTQLLKGKFLKATEDPNFNIMMTSKKFHRGLKELTGAIKDKR